jgi:hypothetical protein
MSLTRRLSPTIPSDPFLNAAMTFIILGVSVGGCMVFSQALTVRQQLGLVPLDLHQYVRPLHQGIL